MICRKSEEIFKRQNMALLERLDASDVLSQVQIPTLVMAGAFDSWATEEPQLVAHLFNQWLA